MCPELVTCGQRGAGMYDGSSLADDPERRLTLHQADRAREDFATLLDELDLVKGQFARLPQSRLAQSDVVAGLWQRVGAVRGARAVAGGIISLAFTASDAAPPQSAVSAHPPANVPCPLDSVQPAWACDPTTLCSSDVRPRPYLLRCQRDQACLLDPAASTHPEFSADLERRADRPTPRCPLRRKGRRA
jgi:hypothetical protein